MNGGNRRVCPLAQRRLRIAFVTPPWFGVPPRAYGGIATKRAMLAIEGVTLAASPGEPVLGFDADAAAAHLSERDPRLARVIAEVGPPRR